MRTLNRFITHKEEGEERVEKAIFQNSRGEKP